MHGFAAFAIIFTAMVGTGAFFLRREIKCRLGFGLCKEHRLKQGPCLEGYLSVDWKDDRLGKLNGPCFYCIPGKNKRGNALPNKEPYYKCETGMRCASCPGDQSAKCQSRPNDAFRDCKIMDEEPPKF